MKFQILTEVFQKKLPLVTHIASPKSTLPVLANILLETQKNKIRLSATDLEIGIQVEIPATIEEEGATTVPAKIFSELIMSLPNGKITIQTEENTLIVHSAKTKSSFQTIVKEEFPKLFEEKGEQLITISRSDIQNSFSRVVFAASQDTGRPALSGILVQKEEKGFLLVATDGYRLSLKHFDGEKQKLKGEKQRILIPARVIKEIINLKEEGEEVGIYLSDKSNQILFQQGETIIVSRLIEAEFPQFEKIIPTDYGTRAFFDKEEAHKAAKMCAIFARETANIVKLAVQKNKIIFSANMPSVGENTAEIEAKTEGEENEVAFNGRYLLDFFANVDMDDVLFEMTGPLSPGVFKSKSDGSYLHIIMPIRIQTENE